MPEPTLGHPVHPLLSADVFIPPIATWGLELFSGRSLLSMDYSVLLLKSLISLMDSSRLALFNNAVSGKGHSALRHSS